MVKKKYMPSELEKQTIEEFKDKIENLQKENLSQEDYDKFTKEIGLVLSKWNKKFNIYNIFCAAFQFLFYQICVNFHTSGLSKAEKRTKFHSFVSTLFSFLESTYQEAKENVGKSTWN